ncbi:Crp/Fnr family transcriptional regulator [Pedobacter sp. AW1-32]|uniref:Crp/Fnr family transcriptional regulator n=1 Tax=Pedobacter sp. AW1-32 TaxID=3383026 RepID=UPI003FF0F1D7
MSELEKNHLIQSVLSYFRNLTTLSDGFVREIEGGAHFLEIKKNKYILSPLEYNSNVFFLAKGLARGFVKYQDKELTTWISLGNEFISAIQNPYDNLSSPSIEYIQSLEDAKLVAIPQILIYHLYDVYPETNIIGRKILNMQHHQASERAILARLPTAENRYERFMETHAHVFARVPLRCIASYLGMRLETLSRIRNRADKVKI